MIPPIERILDVNFSYANLCLIFNPRVIKNFEQLKATKQVLQQFNSKLGTNKNLELTQDEKDYVELLIFLVEEFLAEENTCEDLVKSKSYSHFFLSSESAWS